MLKSSFNREFENLFAAKETKMEQLSPLDASSTIFIDLSHS
jgi:hypothetical protein